MVDGCLLLPGMKVVMHCASCCRELQLILTTTPGVLGITVHAFIDQETEVCTGEQLSKHPMLQC